MPTVDEPIVIEDVAEVTLLVADGGYRSTSQPGPKDLRVGRVWLRNWHLYPVRDHRGGGESDGYLVKINFDLVLEPDAPALGWFEIGFEFVRAGDEEFVVVDAVPRLVTAAQEDRSFALDGRLHLVPGADIHLPPIPPVVHLFDVGGPRIRWRHTARGPEGVAPGAYLAWLTVLVPRTSERLQVQVATRFDLTSEEAAFFHPTGDPSVFALGLPARAPTVADMDGIAALPVSDTEPAPPRVFVSYTHDTPAHMEAVRRLAEFLVRDVGLDVHLDRWATDTRRNWYDWAIEQVTSADFVLVIASPRCRAVADGAADPTANRGMRSELAMLKEKLHAEREEWTRKILPVILPGHSSTEIPLFLAPESEDHYQVTAFDPAGAADLLRVLTGSVALVKPPRRSAVLRSPPEPERTTRTKE